MPSLLSQKAVLTSLSISQWSVRKLDKKATEEIDARDKASRRFSTQPARLALYAIGARASPLQPRFCQLFSGRGGSI